MRYSSTRKENSERRNFIKVENKIVVDIRASFSDALTADEELSSLLRTHGKHPDDFSEHDMRDLPSSDRRDYISVHPRDQGVGVSFYKLIANLSRR